MEDVNLEDMGEMEGAELVTSGEEESDDEDLYETMVDMDTLGRDEPAKKKAKIDPGVRKSKDVAKLLGHCGLLERQMKCRLGGWQFWRKLWGNIQIWQVWLKL